MDDVHDDDDDGGDDEANTSADSDAKSTKKPLAKPKAVRKRQAEGEDKLIKGLAESLAGKKEKKVQSPKDTLEHFGNYVTQSLAELDPQICNLAKFKINNILYQAQVGALTDFNNNFPLQSFPPQQQYNWPVQERQYASL